MTRRASFVATALCVLIALDAAGQTPTPGTGRPGSIRGRITSQEGRPLRRAQIMLLPVVQAVGALRLTASANSQGQYELKDVPPGTYRIRATRSGYVAVEFGQRLSSQPGQTIEVRPGQLVERIDIVLPRGGVLAGRIVDETGEPFTGVRVQAQELRYNAGRRAPFPGGSAMTDDVGEFRISGLRPGTYYVMASSTETWVNEKKQPLGFAATYFPGRSARDAQPIAVAAGQERTDLDFMMTVSRTSRISGTVQSAAGAPAAAQRLVLAPEYREFGYISAIGAMNQNTAADGSFEFRNVPPGQYQLRSSAGQVTSGQEEVAVAHLDVTGEDVDGLVLVRRFGSSVSGMVITDDGTPPGFAPTQLRMEPIAIDPDRTLKTSGFLPSLSVTPDWTFSIPNIAGPYVFRVVGLPEEWMLDKVRIQEQDVTDVATDVPTGMKNISGVEVVLTRKASSVSGTVVDGNGRPMPDVTVVVFAEDRDHWGPGSRFVKMARPGGDGRFTMTGLPAGGYRAAASATAVEGEWESVEFLDSVYDEATRVSLSEGSTQTVTLRTREN
jgi:protocatechuate 3,4-dioxygenase beta subunit